MLRDDDALLSFWSKVTPADGGCLLWTRARNSAGYGVVKVRQRLLLAHRWSYWLFKGAIPPGKIILHQCDVHLCVNPAHLIAGNHSKNLRDAWYRRRRFRPNTLTLD